MEACSGSERQQSKKGWTEAVCHLAIHASELFAFFRCLKNMKWFLELSTEPAKILILKHLELHHSKINTEVVGEK